MAELDTGPTEGPSPLRRQLRTLTCAAYGACPDAQHRVDTLLQAVSTLHGPGSAAFAWVTCTITRGVVLPTPPPQLSNAVLPKLLAALKEGTAALGPAQPGLMPLHMAWLLDAVREGLLCLDQQQVCYAMLTSSSIRIYTPLCVTPKYPQKKINMVGNQKHCAACV